MNTDVVLVFVFRPRFGKVYTLSKQEFVDAIDTEKPMVTIIVHLFENVSFTHVLAFQIEEVI